MVKFFIVIVLIGIVFTVYIGSKKREWGENPK